MKKILFFLIAIIGVLSCGIDKQESGNKIIPNDKAIKLDTLFSDLYQKGAFNGNILIAEQGNVTFEKSYGLANEQTKDRLNANTVFELASVSKQFTAMGIVLLVKNKKISYHDLISKYIPELNNYEGITIKNLLIHTGGLADYMQLAKKYWDKTKIATNEDIINFFNTIQPDKKFEPNDKWDYSNTGYLLLAATKFIVDGFSPEVTYTFIVNENNGAVEKYRVQQESQGIDKEAKRIK